MRLTSLLNQTSVNLGCPPKSVLAKRLGQTYDTFSIFEERLTKHFFDFLKKSGAMLRGASHNCGYVDIKAVAHIVFAQNA